MILRLFPDAVAVILMTLALAWTFGHVSLPSPAIDLFVQGAARLGISGIEAVEDFYMAVTLGLSLSMAIATVAVMRRLWRLSA